MTEMEKPTKCIKCGATHIKKDGLYKPFLEEPVQKYRCLHCDKAFTQRDVNEYNRDKEFERLKKMEEKMTKTMTAEGKVTKIPKKVIHIRKLTQEEIQKKEAEKYGLSEDEIREIGERVLSRFKAYLEDETLEILDETDLKNRLVVKLTEYLISRHTETEGIEEPEEEPKEKGIFESLFD